MKRILLSGLAALALAACNSNGYQSARVNGNAPPVMENGYAVAQSGDTLYTLARRFHVSISDLTSLNNIEASHELHQGELLRLPPGAAGAPVAAQGGEAAREEAGSGGEMGGGDMGAAAPAPAAAPEGDVTAAPLDSTGASAPPPAYLPPPAAPAGSPPPAYAAPPAQAAPGNGVSAAPMPGQTSYQLQQMGPMGQPVSPPPQQAAAVPVAAPPPAPVQAAQETPVQNGAVAAAPANAAPAASDVSFQWPLTGRVISGFGKKADGTDNEGIDILAPRGSSVAASAPGVVLYTGEGPKGLGTLVLIRHQGGWITAYAHLDRVTVDKDAVVASGDPIGTVGSSGGAPAPELHFEIRQNEQAVDPRKLLQAGAG